MTSTPKAKLTIEVFEDDDNPTDDLRPAIILSTQSGGFSGVYFEGTVESSLGEDYEPVGSYMEVNIANPSDKLIERLKDDGRSRFVKLEAGWEGSAKAPVQAIFYGITTSSLPYRKGGEKWVGIHATGLPYSLYDTIPKTTKFANSAEDSVTFGAIIQEICNTVSVSANISDALFDYTHPGFYTPQFSVAEELSRLMQKANSVSGKKFGIAPDGTNPLSLHFVDLGVIEGVLLKQNFDSDTMQSVGAIIEAEEDAVFVSSSSSKYSVTGKARVKTGYRVDKRLDPRIEPGLGIQYTGSLEGEGTLLVTSVKHKIAGESGWTTSYEAIDPATVSAITPEESE